MEGHFLKYKHIAHIVGLHFMILYYVNFNKDISVVLRTW
jgi:hypothetical protein